MRQTNRPLTVAALLLAFFMAAMEMTVVSTAMPTVVAELGGALHYAWVFTAYMLTSTVTVPLYGKLADLYGRKPVMLVGMALFLIGSMASGQARTMNQLIVFRALQGVGAGGMQPVAMTIIGDIFNLDERARMQGVFGAVWGFAGLAGPLIGGLIVDALSWRWVFYVNVPFGLLATVLLVRGLVEDLEPRPDHTLDFAGAGLLSLAVIALLFGTDGIAPAALLPTSIALTAAFIFVERRVKEPILPMSLFSSRTILTSSVVFAAAGGATIGLVTFVPLYAQGVLGASPTEAGTTIAPMAVAWPITSAISGRLIPRFGFRSLVRFGMLVVALAGIALALLVAHGATVWELRGASMLIGAGMGLCNTALLIAVQTSVGFSQRGVATASTMFFRNIGGTVAVGTMGVVLARRLLESEVTKDGGGAELIARILGPERRSIPVSTLTAIATDLAEGLGSVMWIVAALGLVSAAATLLFPKAVPDAQALAR